MGGNRARFGLVRGAALALPLLACCGGQSTFFVLMPQRLPPDTSVLDTSTMDVDLVDVDADGDLDLFVAEGTGAQEGRPNRLLINDGDGFFTDESAERLPPGAANSSRSDEGDVDGDGDVDIVVANLGGEQLLLNDGTGSFTDASAAQLPPPLPYPQDISAEARLADVDGDGDLDILIANENPFLPDPLTGGQNRLYLNDGSGFFTDGTEGRLPAATDQTGALVTGDIDRDGDTDVIVLNRGQDRVLVNNGTGRFQDETAARLPAQDDTSRGGVLADLDGDGDLDLLVANSRGEEPALYFNDGVGDFTRGVFSKSEYPHETLTSVAVGDVDGDGDLDAVFGNAGPWVSAHGFHGGQDLFFTNSGRGLFVSLTRDAMPEILDPTTDVELGDVDGDGDLDIVVGNSGAPESVLIQERR